MRRKRIYISAPISGHDINERRRYFSFVAKKLTVYGYDPVNPLENGLDEYADIKEHMRTDFRMLLDCDMIMMCDGWEDSEGCQKESSLALWSGIPMFNRKSIGL